MVANQQSYKERPNTRIVAYLRVISTPVSIQHETETKRYPIEGMAEVKPRKWIQQRIDSPDPEKDHEIWRLSAGYGVSQFLLDLVFVVTFGGGMGPIILSRRNRSTMSTVYMPSASNSPETSAITRIICTQ
ncbi:uncharacterized protein ASPGLDRAFT_45141 [Aspergillus glaucus CBS 516.65]|uniref:Uncharacterized protein n=1 Tax=Aspergillus glaucus CBS 516.65 TaxID=1160497 RepID=A0A1L9VQC1_ASPGL|nr:hypothetical protein ASPGLDRAFT_45141 [Aspergillus glaucus CBS 516.65]OJJ86109.1 hypothetical protein ASPGLDRAFT_45141 [Aspergillus glaucus CBS 516.65]